MSGASSLIVEDGTGVANANTYVALADVEAFATNRAQPFAQDANISAFIMQAMDYIEAQEPKWQGQRTYAYGTLVQTLSWPRKCVCVNGLWVASNTIPAQLKNALCQLAIAVSSGIVLQPNVVSQNGIKQDKVGPVSTTYFTPSQQTFLPFLAAANTLLAPLYGNKGLLCVGRA